MKVFGELTNNRCKQGETNEAEMNSKALPLWNLYFHSPAVNTTSIVIQG